MPVRTPDWRVWLGLSLTLAWLLLGAVYITEEIGWQNFSHLSADSLGNFLEGAFAPLAFLWLVIGYFLQHKELQQNTLALRAQAEEIHRSAEQAVIQTAKMAEAEIHARQEAFLQISRVVRTQLGTIAGLLYISSQSTRADGVVTPEEQSKLFGSLGQDPDLFSRRLLETSLAIEDEQARFALFYGTAVRARHTNNFIFTFERLMRRSAAVDSDNMIQDALSTSGSGLLYNIATRHRANAPVELSTYDPTGLAVNL